MAFVVFASGMLMLLFFFNLGLAVTLLFCLSASTATATVVILPGLRRARETLVDYGCLWNGECTWLSYLLYLLYIRTWTIPYGLKATDTTVLQAILPADVLAGLKFICTVWRLHGTRQR